MGAAGRKRVREYFTISQTAAKVEEVYDLIPGRSEPRLEKPARVFARSAAEP
jgi:hypothetical protein